MQEGVERCRRRCNTSSITVSIQVNTRGGQIWERPLVVGSKVMCWQSARRGKIHQMARGRPTEMPEVLRGCEGVLRALASVRGRVERVWEMSSRLHGARNTVGKVL